MEKGMARVRGPYHPYISVGRPCDWDAISVLSDGEESE